MTIKKYYAKISKIFKLLGKKMAPTCPITFRHIDGTIVRINALSVCILLFSYIFSGEIAFVCILGIDLIIRLFINKKLSPINHISRLIKVMIRAKTVLEP